MQNGELCCIPLYKMWPIVLYQLLVVIELDHDLLCMQLFVVYIVHCSGNIIVEIYSPLLQPFYVYSVTQAKAEHLLTLIIVRQNFHLHILTRFYGGTVILQGIISSVKEQSQYNSTIGSIAHVIIFHFAHKSRRYNIGFIGKCILGSPKPMLQVHQQFNCKQLHVHNVN